MHSLCSCSAMEQRIASGRRDLFRTRKQNTSRPPSMHVDDFMAKVKYMYDTLQNFSSKYMKCVFFFAEPWREGDESWFSHARGCARSPLHASTWCTTIYAPHGGSWMDGWSYAPSWARLPARDGGN